MAAHSFQTSVRRYGLAKKLAYDVIVSSVSALLVAALWSNASASRPQLSGSDAAVKVESAAPDGMEDFMRRTAFSHVGVPAGLALVSAPAPLLSPPVHPGPGVKVTAPAKPAGEKLPLRRPRTVDRDPEPASLAAGTGPTTVGWRLPGVDLVEDGIAASRVSLAAGAQLARDAVDALGKWIHP